MHFTSLALGLALGGVASAQYTATYDPTQLPPTTEEGQTGTNKCGTASNQTSLCQNVYLNSIDDFCVWGPPDPNSTIGNVEEIVVAYCTKDGHGTRRFPDGTLTGAHFIVAPDYLQVTGMGDFSKINIAVGDMGGELDPHGADGNGNPHGGLVFSNVFTGGTGPGEQIHEWTNFMAVDQFCIRACDPKGARAPAFCQHIYDKMGCEWNIPSDYTDGFTSCHANDVIPMGLYPQPDGSTSTYNQDAGGNAPAQPPAASSQCQTYTSAQLYAGAPVASGAAGNSSASAGASGSATGSAGASKTISGGGASSTAKSSASQSATGAAGRLTVGVEGMGKVLGAVVGSLVLGVVGAGMVMV